MRIRGCAKLKSCEFEAVRNLSRAKLRLCELVLEPNVQPRSRLRSSFGGPIYFRFAAVPFVPFFMRFLFVSSFLPPPLPSPRPQGSTRPRYSYLSLCNPRILPVAGSNRSSASSPLESVHFGNAAVDLFFPGVHPCPSRHKFYGEETSSSGAPGSRGGRGVFYLSNRKRSHEIVSKEK